MMEGAAATAAAVSRSNLLSPFSQAFLGEARNDDGVKGLLRARNGDAQRPVVPLQLHRVDYGARHLQLI